MITNTHVATKKLRIVHSIENAFADTYEPRYSPIMSNYKIPRTNIVIMNNYLPLPSHTTRKRFAWPRLKTVNNCQKSSRNAVITRKSGIIMNKKSFFGNSSISSVLCDPVIAPLSAAITCSSAIPILYQRHAVMKLAALASSVTNKQM